MWKLWACTAVLSALTVVTPGTLGVIFGSITGISLGLSVCISVTKIIEAKS